MVKLLIKIVTVIGLWGLTGIGQAAVTLITPEEIPVLAVDQQEVKAHLIGHLFRPTTITYQFTAGTHDIAVRYEQLFNLNSDEYDVLKSAAIRINADLQDNQTYRLVLVNPPKSYEVAQNYAKQPIIAIIDEQGHTIAQQQGVDNTAKPQLGNGLLNHVLAFRKKPNNDQTRPVNISAGTTDLALSHVEQLKQLWRQASEQEHQEFLQTIIH